MQLRNFVFVPENSACSSFLQLRIEKKYKEYMYDQEILQLVVLLTLENKIPLEVILP